MSEYKVVGKGRTPLPMFQYGFYTLAPMISLFVLATVPLHVLGTRARVVISFPLMACLIAMPYIYMDEYDGMFCMLCQCLPFAAFQRLSDIFWIQPFLYKKDAYISPSNLSDELWSSIRRNKKVVDENNNKEKGKGKAETIVVKDKKFYHLFPPIILNALAYDVCVSYLKTFTSQDLLNIQKHHPWQAFVFFAIGVTFLTVLFNMVGSILQLIYCVAFEHGSYASDEWRNMMDHPVLSSSFEDLWSHRWHRVFRPSWVNGAFKPVYHSIRQLAPKTNPAFKHAAIGLATIAVFVASGALHEYIVLCNAGWTLYTEKYMGRVMLFFVVHGLMVILEKAVEAFLGPTKTTATQSSLLRYIRQFCVVYISYVTFPWFINGFAPWGLYRLQNLTPLTPFLDRLLATTPFLGQYCGSHV